VQVIEEKGRDITVRIGETDHDGPVLPQRRHDVGQRIFQPIDFAALQRGH
jgi:hypothetical protein